MIDRTIKQLDEHKIDMSKITSNSVPKDQRMDTNGRELGFMSLPPACPPSTLLPVTCAKADERKQSFGFANSLSSLRCYSIASLQQCIGSFSQERFLGEGLLGRDYKAKLPDGKVAYSLTNLT